MPEDHEYPSGHKSPKEKQQKVLVALTSAGYHGLTSREMAERENPGDVSAGSAWGSCFTNLHQEGSIKALAEHRNGNHVYVMPNQVWDRETWPGYRHKGTQIVTETETIFIVRHCETCTCEEK
jgi:hypothetical protein